MICDRVSMPNGVVAIVCRSGSRKKCACGNRADLLCDWKVTGKKSGTCDAPICERCTSRPAPDKDLCREHAKAWLEWKADR